MPTFECKKCGRKTRAESTFYCTSCISRRTEQPFEKSPVCCSQPMIEIIED